MDLADLAKFQADYKRRVERLRLRLTVIEKKRRDRRKLTESEWQLFHLNSELREAERRTDAIIRVWSLDMDNAKTAVGRQAAAVRHNPPGSRVAELRRSVEDFAWARIDKLKRNERGQRVGLNRACERIASDPNFRRLVEQLADELGRFMHKVNAPQFKDGASVKSMILRRAV